MAESHLQVNLDGTTSDEKTNLLPQNKEFRMNFLTKLFTRNNWTVSSIVNETKGLWKIIVNHRNNIEFKINLLFSTIRDEKRQPDEFKTQYGPIDYPLQENDWLDLALGVYLKEEDTPLESCLFAAYYLEGINFLGNPSLRVRTKGLQLAQTYGLINSESGIIFRPEFIYYVIHLMSLRQSEVYRDQMSSIVADAANIYISYPQPIQQIFFGAPGVGKSYHLKSVYKNDDDTVRITFHPETDYASFVGCYKPQSDGTDIVYKFQGQAFAEAYIEAWTRFVSASEDRKNYFLVIEEINRGNCAQIFGDIFQLLDRNEQGFSDYSVSPDKDLALYLKETFAQNVISDSLNSIKSGLGDGTILMLPPNLHILATMNTSDQSLFPIDSAFKRRWDWVYMPIETKPEDKNGKTIYRSVETDAYTYDWGQFLDEVNKRIFEITESEDKQLGFWFVKPKSDNQTISANDFVSKVIFYLWNDIYKDFGDDASSIFNFAPDGNPESKNKVRHSFKDFTPHFKRIDASLVDAFLQNMEVAAQPKNAATPATGNITANSNDENSN